ncbi:origin recognition complex subunit 1 [Coccinella septempunctata]|uniref:origin recognition complex subunit 1 n=1 Tax=Coccinella septempunctata TaxID=41139 RepID=UPI001D067A1D|nr:origin recognition complex subunit 1 [Coccinella septempunctata]
MPKQKFVDIKWLGDAVPCYYDNIPSQGDNRIFYNIFIKNGMDFSIGDFAIFNTNIDDPLSQKICQFKCFFQEGNKYKAVVVVFERASKFEEDFRSLNVQYDHSNECVLDSREEKVLDLKHILRKCRVVFGTKDETVQDKIDSHNFTRKIYFLCRYVYTQNGQLMPCFNDQIINDLTIEEAVEVKRRTPLKTPSRKIMSASRSTGVKKNYSEPMHEESARSQSPHLSQVRRNLNNSFNDSLSQDEKSFGNYSIVEQDNENLKIKLRVSNGRVLSKIPSSQPVVLLSKIETKLLSKENDAVYELKSPNFKTLLKKSGNVVKTPNRKNINSNTPEKVLVNLVDNMKIKDKTPVKSSPRKLRRLDSPLYNENYSDTDSDDFSGKRKVAENRGENGGHCDTPVGVRRSKRVKKSGFNRNFEYLTEGYNIQRIKNSARKRKQIDSPIPGITDLDSDDGVPKSSNKNKRKIDVNASSTPSTKSQTPSVKTPSCRSKTPKTMKGTPLKLIRNGILTPSVDQRQKVVAKCDTPLILARNTLHVSYVPKLLPCREKEYRDIYSFIEGKLRDKCGGCMYISGVPGTGKTATVTAAIENITKTWKSEGYEEFKYVCINGMKLTEPRQCYVEILKQLTGKRVPWEQALTMLEKQFTIKSAKKVVPTVLLIDELDILCTKRQDVVYNLLDWPTKTNAQLIVVTIANTMDLPERLLMSRVTSRLGLTRLTFQAYTHKQLQEIVINRLSGNESFRADAVQFVARKVASVSGDARRALDICRRSAEIAELEGPNTQVSMQHVNAALEAMITQPKVKAILHCSKLEKLLLKAVIAEVERTGLEETVFEDVCTTLNSLATLEGFKMVSLSLVSSAVYKLTSCRLLLSDQNCNGLNQRILLNVSSDDVYFALKKD